MAMNITSTSSTALLLSGQGVDGSLTIADATAKAVTVFGDAKISTEHFRIGTDNFGICFTGQYFTVPDHSDFDFGAEDFTIEFWALASGMGMGAALCKGLDAEFGPYRLTVGETTLAQVSTDGVSWTHTFSAPALSDSHWSHVALVRSADVLNLFIDGIGSMPQAISGSLASNVSPLAVGATADGAASFNGCLDDIRLTKGAARYTANFTPPSSPFATSDQLLDPDFDQVTLLLRGDGADGSQNIADLSGTLHSPVDPYTSNIVLLLRMDGLDGGTVIHDSGPFNIAVFRNEALLSSTSAKFGGVSLNMLTGSNKYLTLGAHGKLAMAGDFTVEFWTTANCVAGPVFRAGDTSNATYLYNQGVFVNGVSIISGLGLATTSGVWKHIAITRLNGTVSVYENGVFKKSGYSTATVDFSGALLGQYTIGNNLPMNGYLDELCISNVCRYLGSFTPRTTPIRSASASMNAPIAVLGNAQVSTGQSKFGGAALRFDGAPSQDPHANATVALLQFEGANNSQTFTERNGKPVWGASNARISTEQSHFGSSSIYLDGVSGACLSLPMSSDFTLPSSGFTVEAWIYLAGNALPDGSGLRRAGIVGNMVTASTATSYWTLMVDGSTTATGTGLILEYNVSSVANSRSVVCTISQNAWHHVAVCSDATSVRFYLDGVVYSAAPLAVTQGTDANVYGVRIGSISNLATWERYFNGYLQEVRITKGVARYTDAFTPSAIAFPEPAQNAAIAVQNSQAFALGTSDFTVECWVYLTDYPTSGRAIVSNGWFSGGYGSFLIHCAATTGAFRFYASSSLTSWDVVGARDFNAAPLLNTWYHLAVSRQEGVMRLFCDGNLTAQLLGTPAWLPQALDNLWIGGTKVATDTLPGYVDDVRISRVARYVNHFMPPVAPHPAALGVTDADFSKVALLLKGQMVDAVTSLLDFSPSSKTLTCIGVPTTLSANGAFKGSSIQLDGSGDYVRVGADQSSRFGSGDFTVEAWVNLSALPAKNGYFAIVSRSWDLAQNLGCFFGVGQIGAQISFYLFWSSNGTATKTASTPWVGHALHTWVHVAWVRRGGSFRVFVDGIPGALVTDHGVVHPGSTDDFFIGCGNPDLNPWWFNGYLADVRVVVGQALYLQAFTPPARTLQLQSATVSTPAYLAKWRLAMSKGAPAYGSKPSLNSRVKKMSGNFFFQGPGKIEGTVAEKGINANVPLHRKVLLLREDTGIIIRATWSDASTGAYAFHNLAMDKAYTLISYDYTGAYRAVIADNQKAVLT